MMTGHFGDNRESRMSGLQGRHGSFVVQAVENFAVVHHLGLVLRMGQHVQHVLTSAQPRGSVEMRPLEDVRGLVLCDVTALDALPVVADDGDLDTEVVLALPPAPPDVGVVLRLRGWSQVE